MIKFTTVTKNYPKAGDALRNVTFHVAKGEFAFLTGHSGAGKSTAMRLIYMAERPTTGEVRVSGFAATRVSPRDIPRLRRRLGIVFQDFRLLEDRTAEENVAFALEVTGARRATIGPRVMRVLTQVGLGDRMEHKPNELSGGQRQRVAIARALVNQPSILLADEPTGNLDSATGAEIMRLFEDLHTAGQTIVLVTHEHDIAAHARRQIHLRDGLVERDERMERSR